jgi:hypothetical protein
MKAAKTAATSDRRATMPASPVPAPLKSRWHSASATPQRDIAWPKTHMQPTTITASEEKPAKASAGSSAPHRTRVRTTSSATRS